MMGVSMVPLLKASIDHLFKNSRKPLKDNVKKTKEKGAKWNSQYENFEIGIIIPYNRARNTCPNTYMKDIAPIALLPNKKALV